MRKELYDEQSRPGKTGPGFDKTEGKIRTTKLVSRKVESDQGGLMSHGFCYTLPPVFLLSSWFFLDPPDPPLTRCSESEDSSD